MYKKSERESDADKILFKVWKGSIPRVIIKNLTGVRYKVTQNERAKIKEEKRNG